VVVHLGRLYCMVMYTRMLVIVADITLLRVLYRAMS